MPNPAFQLHPPFQSPERDEFIKVSVARVGDDNIDYTSDTPIVVNPAKNGKLQLKG